MADGRPVSEVTVGVLAMQGAFREHVQLLREIGVDAIEVRTVDELARVDGLVIPGGESTTIRKMLVNSGLYEPLRERLEAGMPAFGTCAGLIVLASAPPDAAPPCYGLFDVEVERNGFGRQVHSFEAEVTIEYARGARCETEAQALATVVPGVFIRAPRITRVGDDVAVIGRLGNGEAVAVRQGVLVGCTFHPELAGAQALHEMFTEVCRGGSVVRAQ